MLKKFSWPGSFISSADPQLNGSLALAEVLKYTICLSWDGFQYYDCDTEFRLSWVQQKFIENRDLMMDSSRTHPYRLESFIHLYIHPSWSDLTIFPFILVRPSDLSIFSFFLVNTFFNSSWSDLSIFHSSWSD